jgi:hypothetical protein
MHQQHHEMSRATTTADDEVVVDQRLSYLASKLDGLYLIWSSAGDLSLTCLQQYLLWTG